MRVPPHPPFTRDGRGAALGGKQLLPTGHFGQPLVVARCSAPFSNAVAAAAATTSKKQGHTYRSPPSINKQLEGGFSRLWRPANACWLPQPSASRAVNLQPVTKPWRQCQPNAVITKCSAWN